MLYMVVGFPQKPVVVIIVHVEDGPSHLRAKVRSVEGSKHGWGSPSYAARLSISIW
jgi:hypothetical protein